MGNRKQPFGYMMEVGVVVINPLEALMVQKIYEEYAKGTSYSVLTQMLKEQPIQYDVGKQWNKNMVARILQDHRYVNGEAFPKIISKDISVRVQERLEKKNKSTALKTEQQKLLRKLSGHNPTENMEKQVINLLNAVARDVDVLKPQCQDAGNEFTVKRLEHRLEYVLEQLPVDEEVAKQLTMELARVRYEALSNSEYETERLKRVFSAASTMENLETRLVSDVVSQIKNSRGGSVKILLTNGQIIE